jgi:multidrug efflux pump subunit AcrA (membrane-fusion protein)
MKTKEYSISAYLFLIFIVVLAACSKSKQTVKPVYKPLVEAVYASGNLLPENEYKVFAQADGYLLRKVVEEGDTVSARQILFELESNKQDIRAQNALEQYRIAKSNSLRNSPILQELEAAMASAKARWQNDSINFIRYKNLLENKATTRIEYDRVSLNYHTSKNEFLSLKNRYEKTKTQLQSELQNAEAQYKLNAEQHADYMIKSRIKGMVYEIYKEEGEMVRSNEPVALLGDPSQVYLKLSVDELDINKIKTGQEVLVKIDTYKNRVFKAKVSKIYPMLNEREQSFRVDAVFIEEPPRLYAGLTVEANIVIQQKDRALTIPKTYLIGEDSVQVEQNGQTRQIKIEKGAENLEYIEVLSGLDTNSVVVMGNE